MKSEEDRAAYAVASDEDAVIAQALRILEGRVMRDNVLSSPASARDYVRVSLALCEHEEFGCIWLDAQNRVMVKPYSLFRGTLTQTSVYPREVVKEALKVNASAVILYHNHPSGTPEPSSADKVLTGSLKTCLSMVDVRVIDHIVVAADGCVSFAERGYI